MSFGENLQHLEQQENIKSKENSQELNYNLIEEKETNTFETITKYFKKYGLENTEIKIKQPKNPLNDLKKDFQVYVYPGDDKTFNTAYVYPGDTKTFNVA